SPSEANAKLLEASGLARLHARGYRGARTDGRGRVWRTRLAVIDSDFRGWEPLVRREGGLPTGTQLLDLTAEQSPDLVPVRSPDDGKTLGHGTQVALAAAVAAPEADLLLIRVNPDTPYQVLSIARAVN